MQMSSEYYQQTGVEEMEQIDIENIDENNEKTNIHLATGKTYLCMA